MTAQQHEKTENREKV